MGATQHWDMVDEIRRLTEQVNTLKMDMKVIEHDRQSARTALQAFQEFDGDEGLWAMMKRERDEAVAKVATLTAALRPFAEKYQEMLNWHGVHLPSDGIGCVSLGPCSVAWELCGGTLANGLPAVVEQTTNKKG